jgi:uncharacterized protein (UPF0333 family)
MYLVVVVMVVAIAYLCVQHITLHKHEALQQNDIVLLKRKYKSKYPQISPGLPLRIIHNNGNEIEVTFVKPSDSFICNEVVNVDAVRRMP